MISLVFVAASSSHWRDRKDKQKSSILHCKCNCECCSEGFLEALPTEWSGKYDELALRCAISGLASLQLTSPMLELGLASYGLTGLLQRQGTRNSTGLEDSLHWWLHTQLSCGSWPSQECVGPGSGEVDHTVSHGCLQGHTVMGTREVVSDQHHSQCMRFHMLLRFSLYRLS